MNCNNIEDVLLKFPNLSFNPDNNILEGSIDIEEGDKYFVKISLEKFPHLFPKVWETNERIPRKADRHINSDNTLCFTTQANMEIYLATNVKTINDFLELILKPYLINNSFFEINKSYRFGEFSHNIIIATKDTYSKILNTENVSGIKLAVNKLIYGGKFRPNDKCFCGSDKKIKKCDNHLEKIKLLSKVSYKTLKNDFLVLDK